ncbi:hypothetical protein BN1708_018206, partial [Verticillium longisporum]
MSFHPQTPQSPSQLSPGTSDLASSMNSSLTSLTTLPTPAHSVNGSTSHPPDTSHDYAMGDDTPQKRKRSIGDVGERDQKKPHVEDGKLDIDDLHQDVGEKYLLCQTTSPPKSHVRNPMVTRPSRTACARLTRATSSDWASW